MDLTLSTMILLDNFFENFKNLAFDFSIKNKIISFCPGSRNKEVHIFMPIFLEIIKKYNNQFKYHFAVTHDTWLN